MRIEEKAETNGQKNVVALIEKWKDSEWKGGLYPHWTRLDGICICTKYPGTVFLFIYFYFFCKQKGFLLGFWTKKQCGLSFRQHMSGMAIKTESFGAK